MTISYFLICNFIVKKATRHTDKYVLFKKKNGDTSMVSSALSLYGLLMPRVSLVKISNFMNAGGKLIWGLIR